MRTFARGRYRARLAKTAADIEAAQRLRALVFRSGASQDQGRDTDPFDDLCHHVLVEEDGTGALVCCFRFMPIDSGSDVSRSYSAQYYELAALADYPGRMVEMGRFCIDPERSDPDILRVAWGAMTAYVDMGGVGLLFGCSSFEGTEPDRYLDAFSILRERHLAPRRWLPRIKAPRVFRFGSILRSRRADPKAAIRHMPPLLRTYLMMGGWVSDHAVVDTDLNTMHVFTGIEIGKVPAGRARLLRAVAG